MRADDGDGIKERLVPRLDVLPAPQRRLWSELGELTADFVLYGDTAIALHLGHRQSVDFDFFRPRPFDPETMQRDMAFLADAVVVQRAPNTLSCVVDRGGPVKVSFFGVPRLPRLRPPHETADPAVHVASLLDLAATKASVVQLRAEAKDYRDLDPILADRRVDLSGALAGAKILYGAAFNPQMTLKALSYFEDGDLPSLPAEVRERLAAAARHVDLGRLPVLAPRCPAGEGA